MPLKKTSESTSKKTAPKKSPVVKNKVATTKVAATKKTAVTKKVTQLKKVLNPASDFLKQTIIESIEDIKGENIIAINLQHLPESVADYFIICEATTFVQLRGIAENIEKKVKETCEEKVFRRNIEPDSAWLILDYIDIVVHLFLPEQRAFYALEECWSDGTIEKF